MDQVRTYCKIFQYSVKLGRHIVQSTRRKDSNAKKYWEIHGTAENTHVQFWFNIWNANYAMKVVVFIRQFVHRALPVRSWARRFGMHVGCAFCGLWFGKASIVKP